MIVLSKMRFCYHIELLNKAKLKNVEDLLPKNWEERLDDFDPERDLVLGAVNSNRVLGILWSVIFQQQGKVHVHILLLKVQSQFRRKGIGTDLFHHAEQEANRRKANTININLAKGDSFEPIGRILQRRGWEPPKITGYFFETTVDRFFNDLRWTDPSKKFPYRSYIRPWADITPEELDTVRKEEGSYYAQAGVDFLNLENIEPINSLILRDKERLIGWLITHRTAPDTIHYTSVYIVKEYRGLGFTIPLCVEAGYLQKAACIPKITLWVLANNKSAVKFWSKILAPAISRKQTCYYSYKELAENSKC